MLSITKTYTFSAAHRLLGHPGHCSQLHGHNYSVVLELEGPQGALGMVVDFATIKSELCDYIATLWDHGTILNVADPLVRVLLANGQDVYTMDANPTAENMALLLLQELSNYMLGNSEKFGFVQLSAVTIEETESCWATATKE